MTMSPTAVRTARRDLVQRIDRFVKRVQVAGFQPGPDAITNFQVALECLERADYPAAEDAMMCSEYGFAPRFAPPQASPPLPELISRFGALRSE